MDNAKNNDTLMKSLWEYLDKTTIFSGINNEKPSQVRCLAHVMNIAIQAALGSLCCQPTSGNMDHQDAPLSLKNVRKQNTTIVMMNLDSTNFFFSFGIVLDHSKRLLKR